MVVWLHGSGHGGWRFPKLVPASKLQQSIKPLTVQDATMRAQMLPGIHTHHTCVVGGIYIMTADVSFCIYGGTNTPYQQRMEKQVTGSHANDIYMINRILSRRRRIGREINISPASIHCTDPRTIA